MTKRSTIKVLEDELASARKVYGKAIERRDQARKSLDAAKAALSLAEGHVEDAKVATDRSVAAIEAFTGEQLAALEETPG